jgi:hypothetical protein
MNKGIVMEIGENSIIVMDTSGRFDQLPRGNRNCVVGEEILYAGAKPRPRVPFIALASGLVAAVVLGLVLVTALSGNKADGEVVAYVSIDINPSVEIGIDNKEIVRDLRGLNTDGINLIDSLAYQGKKLEDVTAEILDKAEQGALAKGEGDIIISSTIVRDTAKVNDQTIADQLKQQVTKHIADAHPNQTKNYEVTAFAAPQELRDEAKTSGVSAGKYAVYLNALNNGTKVSLDDIQNLSIHQIAKDNGGIAKLIDPDQPINKVNLKQLLSDEKSGKLAEKAQQLEDSKNSKTDKTDKSGSKTDKTTKPVSSKINENDNKVDKHPASSKEPSSSIVKKDENKNNKSKNNSSNDINNSDNNAQSNSKQSPSPTPSPTPKIGSGSNSGSNTDDNNDKSKKDNKGKQDKKGNSNNKGDTNNDTNNQ